MRGRKPKPTSLKLLDGTQKCRINHAEPVLPVARVESPPAWLGAYGAELWRKLCPMLVEAGMLTVGDMAGFAVLCDEYDTIRRDPLDFKARDRYRRMLIEYGLTPSSRSRLKSTKAGPIDRMAEFLQRETVRNEATKFTHARK